jgi:hypothetical protein
MPEYVAKRSSFVNTFLQKKVKKIKLYAGSKVADEQLKDQVQQVTNLAVLD